MKVQKRENPLVDKIKQREASKRFYAKNKDKIKESNRIYRETNEDKAKEYRTANKEKKKEYNNKPSAVEKRKEYNRIYNAKNKDKAKEQNRLWYAKNKDKVAEEGKIYRLKNKEKNRINRLKRYGLTLDDFSQLFTAQEGRCAICKITPKARYRNASGLCVDHDHTSGFVRGLLCNPCNQSLGLLKDSVETFKNAIEYMEKAQSLDKLKSLL